MSSSRDCPSARGDGEHLLLAARDLVAAVVPALGEAREEA